MLKDKKVLVQRMISAMKSFFEYFILRFWLICTLGFLFWLVFSGCSIEVIGKISEHLYKDLSFLPEQLLTILIIVIPLLFCFSLYYFCSKFERKD